MVADSHQLDGEQYPGPDLSKEKLDPDWDPHKSEKLDQDPDPH